MAGEPDDQLLMQRYRDGDGAAFRLLYARHKGPLYRFFLRQLPDADTAADLFQEAWTKIIRARRNYEPTARFNTYLYRVAHNCLVDHWRKLGRTPLSDGTDPEVLADPEDTEQAVNREQMHQQLQAVLATLPEAQRNAFLLREEGGLSLAEIAGVTGVAEETAKSRLRYAVRKLRAALGSTGAP